MNSNPRDRKPCLIIGNQGVGKTVRLYQLLSKYSPKRVSIKMFSQIKEKNKNTLSRFDAIGIDGLTCVDEIFTVAKLSVTWQTRFFIISQLKKSDIPKELLAFFEVIDMDEETKTAKSEIV